MTFSASGGGGTLALPSPNHVHRVNVPPPAARSLRRSISQSPTKSLSRTSSSLSSEQSTATAAVSPSPGLPSILGHSTAASLNNSTRLPGESRQQPSQDDSLPRPASLPSLSVTTPRATRTQEGAIETPRAKSSTNIGVLPPPASAHKSASTTNTSTPHQTPPLQIYHTPNRRTALHFRSVKNNRNLQATRLAHARGSPKSPSKTPASLVKRLAETSGSPKHYSTTTPKSTTRRPLTRSQGTTVKDNSSTTPLRTLRSLTKPSRHSQSLDTLESSPSFKPIPEHPDADSLIPLVSLKRSKAMMADPVDEEGPAVKRRGVNRAPDSSGANIFDQPAATANTASDDEPMGFTTPCAPIPTNLFPTPSVSTRKSASLRKSTLQQRQIERASLGRRSVQRLRSNSGGPTSTPVRQPRPRLSADQFAPPSTRRENPFANPPPLPNPRLLSMGKKAAHPLSNAAGTTESSGSVTDFSRSLPIGAMRAIHGPAAAGSNIMSTPKFDSGGLYQKAFLSTGLVSKVNRNPELELESKQRVVPDTPCKKPSLLFNTFSSLQDSGLKQSGNSLGAMDSPAATTNKRLSLFKGPRSARRLLFDTDVGDSNMDHQEDGLPSTPTKPQPCNLFGTPATTRTSNDLSPSERKSNTPAISAPKAASRSSGLFGLGAENAEKRLASKSSFLDARVSLRGTQRRPSPLRMSSTEPCTGSHNGGGTTSDEQAATVDGGGAPATTPTPASRGGHDNQQSPHTPSTSHLMPPLGAREPPSTVDTRSSPTLRVPSSVPTAAPVTPTTRDFLRTSLATPGNLRGDINIDSTLVTRFSKVEPLGKGQFSTVYKVTSRRSSSKIFPARQSPVKGSLFFPSPERVYAVKKSKDTYRSNAERTAKLAEVRILKALQNAHHVIRFVDSWEDRGHLYIQTEFCEEGNLGSFLEDVGRTGRLDDFRIWKVLEEITLGLKAIHNGGFVHLDLKPANVLVTFEGVLKIADFGLAQPCPVPVGADIEGDRVYLAPEALESSSAVWSAVDIYSFGLMVVEIACNINLPQNGDSWQALRRDCFDEVPTLTLLSATEPHYDSFGVAVQPRLSDLASNFGEQPKKSGEDDDNDNGIATPTHSEFAPKRANLAQPPKFMSDEHDPASLDHLYKWMLARDPAHRPTADDLVKTEGMMWVSARRQSPATVYEGNFGPGDDGLAFPKVVVHDNDAELAYTEFADSEMSDNYDDDDTMMGGL